MSGYLARLEVYSDEKTPEGAAREAFALAQTPDMTTAAFGIYDARYGGLVEAASVRLGKESGRYLARWEINDYDVDLPEEIAKEALRSIQAADTIATYFEVFDGRYGGLIKAVDLTLLDTGVQW